MAAAVAGVQATTPQALRRLLVVRDPIHHYLVHDGLAESGLQPLDDEVNRDVRDVDAYPRPTELLRRVYRRPAPAERVQDHRTGIGSELDVPFQQRQGLLGWVAEPFSS